MKFHAFFWLLCIIVSNVFAISFSFPYHDKLMQLHLGSFWSASILFIISFIFVILAGWVKKV